MPMFLKCYQCDASIEVREGDAGLARCPACGAEREIPSVVYKSGLPPTSRLAILAALTGALFIPLFPALLGTAARTQIRDSGGVRRGDGLAKFGIFMGLLSFLLCIAAAWVVFNPERVFPYLLAEKMTARQDGAAKALLTLSAQQINFRENDQDDNDIRDYWVADVAGLYQFSMKKTKHPELIGLDIARADRTPLPGHQDFFQPRDGYVFQTLPGVDRRVEFAFTCWPRIYGYDGLMTYYVDERKDVWEKDLKGLGAEGRMKDPEKEGWSRKY